MKAHVYPFLKEAGRVINSGQSRSLAFTGNIHDLFCAVDSNRENYVPLVHYLAASWNLPGIIVIVYELNGPIRFLDDVASQKMRDAWLRWRSGYDSNELAIKRLTAKGKAAADLDPIIGAYDENLRKAINNPTLALELLRQMCLCSRSEIDSQPLLSDHLILIVESADMVIPEAPYREFERQRPPTSPHLPRLVQRSGIRQRRRHRRPHRRISQPASPSGKCPSSTIRSGSSFAQSLHPKTLHLLVQPNPTRRPQNQTLGNSRPARRLHRRPLPTRANAVAQRSRSRKQNTDAGKPSSPKSNPTSKANSEKASSSSKNPNTPSKTSSASNNSKPFCALSLSPAFPLAEKKRLPAPPLPGPLEAAKPSFLKLSPPN